MAEKKFEKALERLEDIVRRLEEGEMTLDESLKAFEEGIRLARFCSKKLDEAERKVEVLLADEEGFTVEPFPGESEPGEEG
ncbi:MAG: exodeoxyribonuclease VII small subunit [Deltaproteobacteria bacterium]|nr:exodeoxyribonuclease VII small subunit [Deltaproteobacteria bacterium]